MQTQDTSQKAIAGFDAHVHFRCPSDLMPLVHSTARRRGLTSASWLRMVIFDALEGTRPQEAA